MFPIILTKIHSNNLSKLKCGVLFCCLLFIKTSIAQHNTITLQAENKSLLAVINDLSVKYKLQFAYSSDQVNLEQLISIDLNNVAPETALKRIFANTGIAYSVSGTQVVLYKDPDQRYTISGRIREKETGELLIGVIIGTIPTKAGVISNGYGFYSLTLPTDTYAIQFNYIGFKPVIKKIILNQSINMDIEMEASSRLEEVIIDDHEFEKEHSLNSVQVPLKEITQVPMILGEKDVVKYIMLMPGLQKGNEGNSYMYVRGGGPDQNLIMIDDAVIYNAYHYLGLSSLFSGSELRNAELIKGGFSSRYGGRLSSVLNMSLKDGNREKFGTEATLGVISSRILVEGPVQKGKSSFFISARKSYIDKVSELLIANKDERLDYAYYDVHAKLSADIGLKDRVMLSGYIGHDLLDTNSDPAISNDRDGISWGNRAATLRWNHQYSGKLFSNTSLVYSYYKSQVAFAEYSSMQGMSSSALKSTVKDYTLKYDLDYLPSGFQRIKTGLGFTSHQFQPVTSLIQDTPAINQIKDDSYYADEAFAYGEYSIAFASGIKVVPGIRMSYYSNQISYLRAEPRLNVIYSMKKNWSINAAYDLMNQYVHLISTFSGFGFPSDIWTSSDNLIKPQRAQVISAGIYKNNIKNSSFSFAIEGYYKYITNMAVMKGGTSFFQLLPVYNVEASAQNWNELLTQGTCTSYGTEMQLKKEGKRFSGWISYTLSKTTVQADEVNRGNPYPASYDRRHDFGMYMNYKTEKHFIFSVNWIYGTGNAISFPAGEFYVTQTDAFQGTQMTAKMYDYEEKNSFRMKPFHRLDLSVQFKHLISKKIESTIEFSIYNVYNRANPFFYQITYKDEDPGSPRVLKQMSLFPIMPSLSWTIKI